MRAAPAAAGPALAARCRARGRRAAGAHAGVPARPRRPSRAAHGVVVHHRPRPRRAGAASASRSPSSARASTPRSSMQSRFAAKQLLFAHAAVTDVQGSKLWHDQRIARAGFGVAEAADRRRRAARCATGRCGATDEALGGARMPAGDFTLDLRCTPTQPVLLQGDAGPVAQGPAGRSRPATTTASRSWRVSGPARAARPAASRSPARPGWTTSGARR